MGNRNIDIEKNKLSFQEITSSDTLSQFMEKVNNNFSKITENNGGPIGKTGEKGDPGVPTKPKVPIHVWKKGENNEYEQEKEENNNFYIQNIYEDLTNNKYQEGHLIILENAHVYKLEIDNEDKTLKPIFIYGLQSIDPKTIFDGKSAYIHIAYSDYPKGINSNGDPDFITDQDLKNENIETFTYNIDSDSDIKSYSHNKLYMGIYSDNEETSKKFPYYYTWFRIRGFEYNAMLSNQINTIFVDENNNCIYKNTESTLIYLYDNTFNLSSNKNVSISLPKTDGYFTIEKEEGVNKVVFNPIVNNKIFKFENDQYKLPITLTYNDDISGNTYTTTIYWILTPIKSLDIEVFVDKNIVNTSNSNKHDLKVGYYLIYPNGDKKIIDEPSKDTIGYKIVLTNDLKNLNNEQFVKKWDKVIYDFTNKNFCYVVLIDSNKNIIDYTTVNTVNNGIHIELTREHIILPYNIDKTGIHPDYTSDIQLQILLYNGDVLIENENEIEYNFYKIKNNVETDITNYISKNDSKIGIYTINKDIIEGNIEILCRATYKNKTSQKSLFIELKETPYKLELNKNILLRNNLGAIKTDKLICYIKYFINGSWKKENEDKYTIKASWGDGYTSEEKFDYNNDGNYVLYIDNKNFLNERSIEDIRISCYKTQKSEELLYEIITILNDGASGNSLDSNPKGVEKIEIKENNIIITGSDNKRIANFSSNLTSDDTSNINYANIYTQIYQNGVIIKSISEDSNDTIFEVKKGEILMRVGNFGIKISSEGIKDLNGRDLVNL